MTESRKPEPDVEILAIDPIGDSVLITLTDGEGVGKVTVPREAHDAIGRMLGINLGNDYE